MMPDTVPVDRRRLHDALECLDVALRQFDEAATAFDLLDAYVDHPGRDYFGAGGERVDTAHLLVRAVRQSLDDALACVHLGDIRVREEPSLTTRQTVGGPADDTPFLGFANAANFGPSS